MGKRLMTFAIAGAAAIAVLWFLPERETMPPPQGPEQSGQDSRHQPNEVTSSEGRKPSATIAAGDEEATPGGLDPEEAERRRRLLELEHAADRRFDETVRLDGLTAEDVQPEVRSLFETLTLEPAFDLDQANEGYVNGMRIAEISRTNPLAQAGFRAGDRIVQLNGQPLVDPAEIAYTMISLGSSFEVCAARDGGRYCRIVSLGDG